MEHDERGREIDPLGRSSFDISKQMKRELVGMGIRAEFANPVGRRELDLTRNFGVFGAPDSLVGPGKFKNSAPATLMSPARNIDSVSLLTRIKVPSSQNQANYSFYSEAGELMSNNSEIVEAALGVIAVHDTAVMFEAAKPSVLATMKESASVSLEPGQVADILGYDDFIWGAFGVYIRAAGYFVDVAPDIDGMTGDEVNVKTATLQKGKLPFGTHTEIGNRSDAILKVRDRELLDPSLSAIELGQWREIVQGKFGENEEKVAFALAMVLGLFNLSRRAKFNWAEKIGTRELKKEEIINPLAISQLRTICNSEWVANDVGSFFGIKNVPVGLKGGESSIAEIVVKFPTNARNEIVEALRKMQPGAIRAYWRKMGGLKEQHDTWGWVASGYSPDGKVRIPKGTLTADQIEGMLASAEDSQVLSKATAYLIGRKVGFVGNIKFKG